MKLPSPILFLCLFVAAVQSKVEPQPEVGSWAVYDYDREQICIFFRVATQLNITYETYKSVNKIVYNIPGNTHTQLINGDCATNGTQSIVVSWKSPYQTFAYDSFAFTFQFNQRKQQYSVVDVTYRIVLPDARLPIAKQYRHSTPIYTTPSRMSYECVDLPPLNLLTADSYSWVDGISLQFLRFQAFADSDIVELLPASECGYRQIDPIQPPTQDDWYNMFLSMVGRFITNTTSMYQEMKRLRSDVTAIDSD
ncbi:uncharacterized protein LOC119069430 [Bradysia coprophila]|uniref:uncharacterized protein LOC119069430 n=1 Tax=Bradysia coprophila TaxID=38358 RepID=UPI00187D9135|nr:uncharacterized protein LOC119069430 [Bradysia coprophila]